MGRFLTPDWAATPVPIPYAVMGNPQTLNLYSYVENNPITSTDPDGHFNCGSGGAEKNCQDDAKEDKDDAEKAKKEKAQNTEVAQNQQPQQNQQPSNSSNDPNYKPGIPHAKGELEKVLACTQTCTGKEFTVTSTNEPVKGHSDIHQPDTPHGRGEAADIRLPGGKADVGKALHCAANCGAKAAFDEYNHPSPHATGPHLHIQTVPTKSGGRGDLPQPED